MCNDVVGIEFQRQGETRGGFFQFIGALQLHAPEIQAARIKVSGQDGILILFAGHMKFIQQPLAPVARRVRVGRHDRADDGSERLRFRARPERLVPGNLIFIRQRRQERIFWQYFKFVNQAVRLLIELLEVKAVAGVEVVKLVGLGEHGQNADQSKRADQSRFFCGYQLRPFLREFFVQKTEIDGRVQGMCVE